jgi:6-phosphogluconolactonase (cycloisomerase 2 family)
MESACCRSLLVVSSALVSACGGGGGGADPAPAAAASQYTIGGSVSGLVGSGLVLQNKGAGNMTVAANGGVTFPGSAASGVTYNVSVANQPTTPSQTCVVANPSGTVGSSNITNVAVTCATNSFAVTGTVTGLAGTGLTLQNGGQQVAPAANGTFTFSVESGSAYNITVASQPTNPSQTCIVANGSGTMEASDIVNVTATCTTNTYAVGGSVSGLLGSGFELQINGGDDLAVGANGAFSFGSKLQSNAAYSVSVKTQPASPSQTCVVLKGTGTVTNAAVDGVAVTCTMSPARFAYVATIYGIFCHAIDAISGKQVALYNTQCAEGHVIATEPSGKFAYVIDRAGSRILPYRIDQATGALVRLIGAELPTGPAPYSLAVDPSGTFVYVMNVGMVGNNGSVSAYEIDPATGTLTEVGGSPFVTAGQRPQAVTIDPTGQFLYAATPFSSGVGVFTIDPGTGALTPAAGSPFAVGAAADIIIDPTAKFAFAADLANDKISVFDIDGGTGALTPVAGSPFATGDGPSRAAIHPSGSFLYVSNQDADTVSAYAVNPTTGSLTLVPGPSFSRPHWTPLALAMHPSGDFLYVAYSDSTNVDTLAIDPTTGALTLLGQTPLPFIGFLGDTGVAISP